MEVFRNMIAALLRLVRSMRRSSNVNHYSPEFNDWLRTADRYQGRATLYFREPQGSVEGNAQLVFNETGKVRVEVRLDPSTLRVESGNSEGLLPFLWPGRDNIASGRRFMVLSPGDPRNSCSRLEMVTPLGVLATEDVDGYEPHVSVGASQDGITLTFEPYGAAFDVVGADRPKYWVVPLLNFVSVFPQRSPDTDHHPLRIYQTPMVPDNLPEEGREAALEVANAKNELILFKFEGRPGFVERLPDYEEHKDELREGRTCSAATAVVVGEVGDCDPQELEDTFASDIASLLSLATGTEVTAPSLEFRDEEGRLVRRLHYRLSPAPYLEGHRLMADIMVPPGRGPLQATGLLLSEATSSSGNGFGESYLRVAMKHLVRAGSHGKTVDEQMTSLCRCLDSLCKSFGVDQQKLKDLLSKQELDDVKDTLSAATKAIQPLVDNARASNRLDAARVLKHIAEKARQASNIGKPFGLAVVDLLGSPRIKLPDADIADAYYAANPHADGTQTWASIISKYRGDVIHHGYFPFSEKHRDPADVARVVIHLHDVTARVIFKILGYNGRYRPRTSSSTREVEWVNTSTSPAELGYQ